MQETKQGSTGHQVTRQLSQSWARVRSVICNTTFTNQSFAGNDDLAREYQDTFVDIFMIKIQNTDLSDDCIEQEMIDPTQQNIPATRT